MDRPAPETCHSRASSLWRHLAACNRPLLVPLHVPEPQQSRGSSLWRSLATNNNNNKTKEAFPHAHGVPIGVLPRPQVMKGEEPVRELHGAGQPELGTAVRKLPRRKRISDDCTRWREYSTCESKTRSSVSPRPPWRVPRDHPTANPLQSKPPVVKSLRRVRQEARAMVQALSFRVHVDTVKQRVHPSTSPTADPACGLKSRSHVAVQQQEPLKKPRQSLGQAMQSFGQALQSLVEALKSTAEPLEKGGTPLASLPAVEARDKFSCDELEGTADGTTHESSLPADIATHGHRTSMEGAPSPFAMVQTPEPQSLAHLDVFQIPADPEPLVDVSILQPFDEVLQPPAAAQPLILAEGYPTLRSSRSERPSEPLPCADLGVVQTANVTLQPVARPASVSAPVPQPPTNPVDGTPTDVLWPQTAAGAGYEAATADGALAPHPSDLLQLLVKGTYSTCLTRVADLLQHRAADEASEPRARPQLQLFHTPTTSTPLPPTEPEPLMDFGTLQTPGDFHDPQSPADHASSASAVFQTQWVAVGGSPAEIVRLQTPKDIHVEPQIAEAQSAPDPSDLLQLLGAPLNSICPPAGDFTHLTHTAYLLGHQISMDAATQPFAELLQQPHGTSGTSTPQPLSEEQSHAHLKTLQKPNKALQLLAGATSLSSLVPQSLTDIVGPAADAPFHPMADLDTKPSVTEARADAALTDRPLPGNSSSKLLQLLGVPVNSTDFTHLLFVADLLRYHSSMDRAPQPFLETQLQPDATSGTSAPQPPPEHQGSQAPLEAAPVNLASVCPDAGAQQPSADTPHDTRSSRGSILDPLANLDVLRIRDEYLKAPICPSSPAPEIIPDTSEPRTAIDTPLNPPLPTTYSCPVPSDLLQLLGAPINGTYFALVTYLAALLERDSAVDAGPQRAIQTPSTYTEARSQTRVEAAPVDYASQLRPDAELPQTLTDAPHRTMYSRDSVLPCPADLDELPIRDEPLKAAASSSLHNSAALADPAPTDTRVPPQPSDLLQLLGALSNGTYFTNLKCVADLLVHQTSPDAPQPLQPLAKLQPHSRTSTPQPPTEPRSRTALPLQADTSEPQTSTPHDTTYSCPVPSDLLQLLGAPINGTYFALVTYLAALLERDSAVDAGPQRAIQTPSTYTEARSQTRVEAAPVDYASQLRPDAELPQTLTDAPHRTMYSRDSVLPCPADLDELPIRDEPLKAAASSSLHNSAALADPAPTDTRVPPQPSDLLQLLGALSNGTYFTNLKCVADLLVHQTSPDAPQPLQPLAKLQPHSRTSTPQPPTEPRSRTALPLQADTSEPQTSTPHDTTYSCPVPSDLLQLLGAPINGTYFALVTYLAALLERDSAVDAGPQRAIQTPSTYTEARSQTRVEAAPVDFASQLRPDAELPQTLTDAPHRTMYSRDSVLPCPADLDELPIRDEPLKAAASSSLHNLPQVSAALADPAPTDTRVAPQPSDLPGINGASFTNPPNDGGPAAKRQAQPYQTPGSSPLQPFTEPRSHTPLAAPQFQADTSRLQPSTEREPGSLAPVEAALPDVNLPQASTDRPRSTTSGCSTLHSLADLDAPRTPDDVPQPLADHARPPSAVLQTPTAAVDGCPTDVPKAQAGAHVDTKPAISEAGADRTPSVLLQLLGTHIELTRTLARDVKQQRWLHHKLLYSRWQQQQQVTLLWLQLHNACLQLSANGMPNRVPLQPPLQQLVQNAVSLQRQGGECPLRVASAPASTASDRRSTAAQTAVPSDGGCLEPLGERAASPGVTGLLPALTPTPFQGTVRPSRTPGTRASVSVARNKTKVGLLCDNAPKQVS